jgi:hypothetical protein
VETAGVAFVFLDLNGFLDFGFELVFGFSSDSSPTDVLRDVGLLLRARRLNFELWRDSLRGASSLVVIRDSLRGTLFLLVMRDSVRGRYSVVLEGILKFEETVGVADCELDLAERPISRCANS